MEKGHRTTIQKNYATLVQECDIQALLPVLVHKKVFSKEMIVKYTDEPDPRKRKKHIFIDVQKRGPLAFANLIAALHETGQHHVAHILDPCSKPAPLRKTTTVPFQLSSDTAVNTIQSIWNLANLYPDSSINLNTEPIRVIVKGSNRLYDDPTKSAVPVYSTHSKKRGIALIINIVTYDNEVHPTRQGADADMKNLTDLFRQMGLEVEAHEDATGSEIQEIILNFKSSPKLKGVDIVFVIIMGHGLCGIIPGIDNKSVATSWIEQQFDNVHCKVLHKRPKIIMYQTCRGTIPDHGVKQRIVTDGASSEVLRTRSDMLIAHSTLSGNVSHRDIYLGSWYIQKFCEIMMEHAHENHLEDIFKMVDNQLSHLRSLKQTMQTSSYTNQGFKICYVHPKIYAVDGVIKDIFSDATIEYEI